MPLLQSYRSLLRPLILTQLCLSVSGLASASEARAKEAKPSSSPVAPASKPSVPASAEAPSSGPASAPGPVAPTSSTVTVINAKKHLLLDAKGYQATFLGDVTVIDPRFSLSCEKLVAYLKRPPAEPKTAAADKPAGVTEAANKPATEGEKSPQGGIEKAVAEGDVIIVQDKLNDKGESERSVARAKKAVYDSLTGNITLSGMPQVEQKGNTIVAAEESTVMILNSKGSLEVLGHSKSVLRNTSPEHGR